MSSGARPYFVGQQFDRPLGHRQLALARERLRLLLVFVDGAADHRRAVRLGQRADVFEFLLAVFQVDRN